jgi:hypothetical protein
MHRLTAALLLAALAAGCAQLPNPFARGPAASVEPAPLPRPTEAVASSVAPPTAPPAAVASAPEALDTVSEAEKQAAREVAATASDTALGQVTVALGDPADPGLWVKSDLVSSERPGTVRTGGGEAIAVTLRPLGAGDGGAQISLSALQALGLPLTGLHPVTLAAS